MTIQNLWLACLERRASDLHLSAGAWAMLRLDGDLTPCTDHVLSHEDIQQILMGLMTSAQQEQFNQTLECDFSLDVPNLSRFRVNAFHQARGVSVVFRVIPNQVPTLRALHAPAHVAELVSRPRGLVLVTGPTGSGKSTTLAALIDELNQT
jgi:twitching motility protein PilT